MLLTARGGGSTVRMDDLERLPQVIASGDVQHGLQRKDGQHRITRGDPALEFHAAKVGERDVQGKRAGGEQQILQQLLEILTIGIHQKVNYLN